MSRYLNYHWFQITALLLVIAEVLSLAAYTLPWLNWIVLFAITVTTLWLLRLDRHWALYLPLAELVWGSLGKSFYWTFGGAEISLRLLLYVLIFFYSLPAIVTTVRQLAWSRPLVRWYGAVVFFLALAVIVGLLRHDSLTTMFFDANNYLYLGYWLVWFDLIPTIDWKKVTAIAVAAVLIVSLKALAIFHIFAHAYPWANIAYLYLWVRDTKVGELTFVTGNVWRVFFQSQLYLVIIWLMGLLLIALDTTFRFTKKNWLLLTLIGSAILISLSRSFGVALIGAVIITIVASLQRLRLSWQRLGLIIGLIVSSAILTLGLLFIPPVDADVAAAFARRLSGGEEAASSRANLFPVMLQGIKDTWITGAGFGSTLTYINKDPRIRNLANPDGTYTTYAFELGWLDFAFKFGILGWLTWFGLIISLLWLCWKRGVADHRIALILTGSGLLFISLTHALTPYLNHPLGLGYLILVWLYLLHDKTQSSH